MFLVTSRRFWQPSDVSKKSKANGKKLVKKVKKARRLAAPFRRAVRFVLVTITETEEARVLLYRRTLLITANTAQNVLLGTTIAPQIDSNSASASDPTPALLKESEVVVVSTSAKEPLLFQELALVIKEIAEEGVTDAPEVQTQDTSEQSASVVGELLTGSST